MRLRSRRAVVTGASRGIGRAVACAFAKEGAEVMLIARDGNALSDVAEAIRASAGRVETLALDISSTGAADLVREAVLRKWGTLDILVANAGMLGPVKPVHTVLEEEWTAVLDTNLRGNLRLVSSLHSLLSASDRGRITAVSSAAAATPIPLLSGYSVS